MFNNFLEMTQKYCNQTTIDVRKFFEVNMYKKLNCCIVIFRLFQVTPESNFSPALAKFLCPF